MDDIDMVDMSLSQGSGLTSMDPRPPFPQYPPNKVLLNCFSLLLQQELEKAALHIIGELKQDFSNLGDRIKAIETKLDQMISAVNQQ
ncbi:hypothetical protein GDO81_025662 [Engystomops pustulosus]|uniref:Uncharacterized protein n=1 Tax=Engystomops pustulosus TaxID=76066 RepID=A0AAV6YI72_ENGPU|nr:hypothetical protein GDO81_025662 [Engystomops pustulosus]